MSTETIYEMNARHKREIEELQTSCKHPEDHHSKWLEHHWAIGHSSGFLVKQCTICGKEVNRKQNCHKCGKEMSDYDWQEGWDILKEIRDNREPNREPDFDVIATGMYCHGCSKELIQEKSKCRNESK